MNTGQDPLRGGVEHALRLAREQQDRLAQLEKEQAELRVVAHSGDGLVSVTLDHAMKVTGIDINARAMRMNSYQLAEALQEALDAGYAECAERTTELIGTALGDAELARGTADGSVTTQDWFKRFGVDLDAMFGRPAGREVRNG